MGNVFSRNRFVLLALAFVVVFVYSVLAGITPILANGPAQDPDTAKFETDFMQKMIDHHNMATEMAKVCLQKAAHEELRGMCQNIIDSQTKEIQEMQSWLQSWYQITKEPMMMAEGEQMMSQLNAASGDEFDKMFMQMMIEHHTTAIEEATACVKRAEHQELKDLCQNIITSQQQEIEQMQTWLAQWYNVSANMAQATPALNATTTPQANATAEPTESASTTLPQTGGAFETNPLILIAGLIFLSIGILLFRIRRKAS